MTRYELEFWLVALFPFVLYAGILAFTWKSRKELHNARLWGPYYLIAAVVTTVVRFFRGEQKTKRKTKTKVME